jgi:glycosyltransferase involved in cell wall biosynthesis
VVIATRNREASLRRTLAALRAQDARFEWELVVVDDGSSPPLHDGALAGLPHARLVAGHGLGPATARNAGLAVARGEVVAFTDDDTAPFPGWLRAAVEHLRARPADAGVEGPVDTPPYDPLRAHSISSTEGGRHFTANIAFRRSLLEELGGFDEQFPSPHCEDLDLAYRAMGQGPIGFAETMRITQFPREQTLAQLARRGGDASSEIRLFRRHRDRFGRAARLPPRLFPLANEVAYWRQLLRDNRGSPRRLARAAALAVAHGAYVLRAVLARSAGRDPASLGPAARR